MNTEFEDLLKIIIGNSNVLGNMSFISFLILIVISLFSSILIGYLYLFFYQNKSTGSQVFRAFPLLGISITTIFICIQFSLPLSLGLLGALSIVRFRTPIKEPEEIGFIMLLIAASIAIATFNIGFLLLLIVTSFLGLFFIRKFLPGYAIVHSNGMAMLTLSATEIDKFTDQIEQTFESLLINPKAENVVDQGKMVTVCYRFDGLKCQSLAKTHATVAKQFPSINLKLYLHKPGIL